MIHSRVFRDFACFFTFFHAKKKEQEAAALLRVQNSESGYCENSGVSESVSVSSRKTTSAIASATSAAPETASISNLENNQKDRRNNHSLDLAHDNSKSETYENPTTAENISHSLRQNFTSETEENNNSQKVEFSKQNQNFHNSRPPSSLQIPRRKNLLIDSQSALKARERALERYSSLQQLHNTTKNKRQFTGHNNNSNRSEKEEENSQFRQIQRTQSFNTFHLDTNQSFVNKSQNIADISDSSDFENLEFGELKISENTKIDSQNNKISRKHLTPQEEYRVSTMKNNESGTQNRQILQNYNRMNQEAGSSSFNRSGRSSIASSSTITNVKTPMSGRPATGMVRTGSSLSSSNISNSMNVNGMTGFSLSPNGQKSQIHQNPLNQISEAQNPTVSPRSHSLAAPRNANNLSLASSSQVHRKTSAGSGFLTPSAGMMSQSNTTPVPKTDSRRKTAKEIAQMYEQLKNKYIERKKEWQIERNELLKKLGLANESQQLLGNMKTMG